MKASLSATVVGASVLIFIAVLGVRHYYRGQTSEPSQVLQPMGPPEVEYGQQTAAEREPQPLEMEVRVVGASETEAVEQVVDPTPLRPIVRPSNFDRVPLPDDYFDSMYAGYTTEELVNARDSTRARFQLRIDSVYAELESAGRYELDEREPNPGGTHIFSAGPEGPNSPIRRVSMLVGTRSAKIYEIPHADYPEVYDLRDELTWLFKETVRRGHIPGDQRPSFVGSSEGH